MIRGSLGGVLRLSQYVSLLPAAYSHVDRLAVPHTLIEAPHGTGRGRDDKACVSAGHSGYLNMAQGLYSTVVRSFASSGSKPTSKEPDAGIYLGLGNLKDNPKATKDRIRAGRGNSSNRGTYGGRGNKGHNARSGGGPHILYDGGQLGLIKFPIVRQRPSYEVLYNQLGLARVVEYAQLGLLDISRVVTMKDLVDTGCVTGRVKYGIMLYGKLARLPFPLHLEVTACDEETMRCVMNGGGSVTRVYYTEDGLTALLKPQAYTSRNLPLPLPAHSWHPKFNSKFDAIGQIPPVKEIASRQGRATDTSVAAV